MVGFVYGAFSGILFSIVIVQLFFLKGKGNGTTIYSSMIKKTNDLSFLEKEEALASLEIIGKGECGKVYKARLPGCDSKMIAIKKIFRKEGDESAIKIVCFCDKSSQRLTQLVRFDIAILCLFWRIFLDQMVITLCMNT